MREAVASVRAPGSGRPVSMSIGVAVGADQAATTHLRNADIAMYQAKRRRSGVEGFGGPPSGVHISEATTR